MNSNTPRSSGEENEVPASESDHVQDAVLRAEEPGAGGQEGSAGTVPPELRAGASLQAETGHEVEIGEALAEDCSSDVLICVIAKDTAVSGQDDAEPCEVMGVDGMILLQSSLQNSDVSDDFANGPLSMELAQNEDSSNQMEVEGSLNLDIFSAKLLDHPYCKSPLEEPSPESTELKSGTRKGGKKNGQKASRVADEQLAAWLCGISFTHLRACFQEFLKTAGCIMEFNAVLIPLLKWILILSCKRC